MSYDINEACRFEALYGGTYIGSHPTAGRNQYMVLRFNFSTMVMSDDIARLEENFNYLNCGPIYEMVRNKNRYARYFENFSFSNEHNATSMLDDVLTRIKAGELPRLYILIDEYDNFTNQLLTTFKDPLYENVTTGDSFLRSFFKTIKKGVDEGSINTCFCTGVLPVTMDDLTSGYNIAEILTLAPNFTEMLGFNHDEAATYLRYVLRNYGSGEERFDEIWTLILNNYDGYRFLPDARPMFNSTILTYFFKKFAVNNGDIPQEMIDENLRTDIGWIRRLTQTLENAQEMLDALLIDDELIYSVSDLRSKFNKKKFFDKQFYPVSLYYLGMTTLKNSFKMSLPNLTMRSIFMDYFNEMNRISSDARKYAPVYEQFVYGDRQLEPLIMNYFTEYLGQLPAQVFDKMNENFIRCSFFELCSRYLSACYTFAVEQNLPSGRADLVLTGMPNTTYHNDCRVVEFKYCKAGEAVRIDALTTPAEADVTQVSAYAADINRQFPTYRMRKYVVYIAAGKVCKVWEV
ncbi:AAA family ATPase [Bacteroides sp. UBA939]|uniref:AAA family ATPase n=1 Tax=Bacteroides sp. UBA939 TaxID=1946092 RepID=UPI0025C5CDD7|nr:AAA family ATPase [Bacteroides sp. UBA939]